MSPRTRLTLVAVLGTLGLACGSGGHTHGTDGTGGSEEEGGTGGSTPTATGGVKGTGGSKGTGGGTGGAIEPDAGMGGMGTGGAGEDAGMSGTGGAGDPGTPGPTDLTKHKYSKVIKLDTTAAGANVMGDVAKYPVAVQLNANNFDFTQAKAAG